MTKKLSRKIGHICATLNTLPGAFLTIGYISFLGSPESATPSESEAFASAFMDILIIPAFIISIAGFIGSLLVRKTPMLGAVLMIVSGALVVLFIPIWLLKITPLFLIIAGVLALIFNRKASNCPETLEETPDSAGSYWRRF